MSPLPQRPIVGNYIRLEVGRKLGRLQMPKLQREVHLEYPCALRGL